MDTIALVTGAGRGLGRSAALHLARRGTAVVGTYRSDAEAADAVVAEITAAGGRATMLPLDVGAADGFDDFATRLGDELKRRFNRDTIDCLVNNAGIGIHAPFAETTEAQLDELLAVHVKGPFLLSRTLLPMIADGGCILNVSSGLARFTLPGYAAYASAKGAVEVLTRYMAKELGPRGIRVNVVAPGAIETDFGGGVVRDNPEVNAFVAANTALGRAGRPEDIGAGIAAIVSGDLAWASGTRIELSGGQSL